MLKWWWHSLCLSFIYACVSFSLSFISPYPTCMTLLIYWNMELKLSGMFITTLLNIIHQCLWLTIWLIGQYQPIQMPSVSSRSKPIPLDIYWACIYSTCELCLKIWKKNLHLEKLVFSNLVFLCLYKFMLNCSLLQHYEGHNRSLQWRRQCVICLI